MRRIPLGALQEREFRLFFTGQLVSLLLSHTARIWELIVLQAFAGTGTAFFYPASTGLTPMTVSPGRLQEANALRGMSTGLTQFAGPALAGLLIVTEPQLEQGAQQPVDD